ncbi:MAG: UDP-N-acetylmuramoyl-tripeptide--D-alanyl-D-alanine ligase, partial [Synergistaceae bacterium]|nr:UDP-N-acetylmuramoyl-tripeptide--D-alanyl-D-alanine ligase [Synergistaceae bacterium]
FFTITEAAEIMGGEVRPLERGAEIMPQNLKADSRSVSSGDAFIAIPGERTDGHRFIGDAVSRGASAVILEMEYYYRNAEELDKLSAVMIPVSYTETAAARLASRWLCVVSPRVVGITGSVGKTTTRELLYGVIHEYMRTHSAVKSYNTLIGCGMAILSMPADTELLILELGANRPGEIDELVKNFPVTHGIITEVAESHLEGLKSIKGVLSAKMEITNSRTLQFLSYNNDNEALSSAATSLDKRLRKASVGFGRSDVTVSDVRQSLGKDGSPNLSLSLSGYGEEIACETRFFGKQHAKNIAFAYAVARDLGLPGDMFAESVRRIGTPLGRGRICTTRLGLIIDETYNANPSSMSYALRNALDIELDGDFRRVAILGGMRELGDETERWHEVIMSRASLFDDVYLIGSEWDRVATKQGALKGRWRSVGDFARDFDFASPSLDKSIILVKGSRFYSMEKLLPMLGVR